MNENQVAALLMSQSACALIMAMAMTAENENRKHRGEAMAYSEKNFTDLIQKYRIGPNDAIALLKRER